MSSDQDSSLITPHALPLIVGGIAEPVRMLDRIIIQECSEPLEDIRGIRNIAVSDVEPHAPFLRRTVAEMLAKAALKFEGDYQLFVVSALRSFAVQKEKWHREYERVKSMHPDWPESSLRRAVNRYYAPVDRVAPPGHCTGGAVDVVLRNCSGEFVDLVPPKIEKWREAATWSDAVEKERQSLRLRLLETMLGLGFSNCRDEYWHFSFGDSGWAVRAGERICCYGVVPFPEGFSLNQG